jgi:hypothetical protein
MNREAFSLARATLRTAVKEYGWHRRPGCSGYAYSPGKFECEHWSIVHFYGAAMIGCAGESLVYGDSSIATDLFEVSDLEREAFGMAAGTVFIALWYSDSGFVTLEELTAADYAELSKWYDNQEDV